MTAPTSRLGVRTQPRAILARLLAAGYPVPLDDLGRALDLPAEWGASWRSRLGRLLRQYQAEGRAQWIPARRRRPTDPTGTPARIPGGWIAVEVAP